MLVSASHGPKRTRTLENFCFFESRHSPTAARAAVAGAVEVDVEQLEVGVAIAAAVVAVSVSSEDRQSPAAQFRPRFVGDSHFRRRFFLRDVRDSVDSDTRTNANRQRILAFSDIVAL